MTTTTTTTTITTPTTTAVVTTPAGTTATATATATATPRISTLIFDVDDTLYDVGTGFTAYRNGPCVQQFMVEKLHFPSLEAAKELRDEYFARYHATAKGLQVAEQEGRLPAPSAALPPQDPSCPRFDPQDLSDYWATHMKFELLGGPKVNLVKDLEECPLTLVAFSNGPRTYVQRVLETLGLDRVFGHDRLFAVDDVLPYCKPEKAAFDVILQRLGIPTYEECVMIEDSMKNIKIAKQLGMKTILIAGKGRLSSSSSNNDNNNNNSKVSASEATKAGDAPVLTDPAVDLVLETVDELRRLAPNLWQTPASFP